VCGDNDSIRGSSCVTQVEALCKDVCVGSRVIVFIFLRVGVGWGGVGGWVGGESCGPCGWWGCGWMA
jgi:hypothetical protein